MISINELNEIKERKKTGLYYEEKEYLQYIFLNAISRYSEEFIFKGGTCLRICFGSEKASEDLDFSTKLNTNKIREIINKCLKDFELLNINYEVYSEKEFEGNLRFEIRLKGPLFQGSLRSTNTLKIDFNKRKARNKSVKIIQKLFSDVPLFSIAILDEKEILAEKIRALINRAESRDLYDIWFLLNKGIKIDKTLLSLKLREENSKISSLRFPSKERYEQDLKNLITLVPPYEKVKKEVLEEFEKIKD